jgi:hypothetical protein
VSMTPAEHYAEAEKRLRQADAAYAEGRDHVIDRHLAAAQVHATLATVVAPGPPIIVSAPWELIEKVRTVNASGDVPGIVFIPSEMTTDGTPEEIAERIVQTMADRVRDGG